MPAPQLSCLATSTVVNGDALDMLNAYFVDVPEEYLLIDTKYRQIEFALENYSRDCPLVFVEEAFPYQGEGEQEIEFIALPTQWISGFSRLERLELVSPRFTAGGEQVGEYSTEIRDDERVMYYRPSKTEVQIRPLMFTKEHRVRYTYTVKHDWSSLPPAHIEFLVAYAAYLVCGILATRYAENTRSVIAADSAAHQSQSSLYAARAKEFFARYSSGISKARRERSLVLIDLDNLPSWKNQLKAGRMFSQRGFR